MDPGQQQGAAGWPPATAHQQAHHPGLRTGEDSYRDETEWGLKGGMQPEQGGTKFQPAAEEARQSARVGA
eukprot:542230-Rhodomonas_salina.1